MESIWKLCFRSLSGTSGRSESDGSDTERSLYFGFHKLFSDLGAALQFAVKKSLVRIAIHPWDINNSGDFGLVVVDRLKCCPTAHFSRTIMDPHPEPVERAVAALPADPTSTLFVGDSIHDLHSGRAAGVLTGAVLWGPFSREELAPAEPDFWFNHPAELKAAIELG